MKSGKRFCKDSGYFFVSGKFLYLDQTRNGYFPLWLKSCPEAFCNSFFFFAFLVIRRTEVRKQICCVEEVCGRQQGSLAVNLSSVNISTCLVNDLGRPRVQTVWSRCVNMCFPFLFYLAPLHQIDVLILYVLILHELNLAWGQGIALMCCWLETAWIAMGVGQIQHMCKDLTKSSWKWLWSSKGTDCFLQF